MKEIWARIEKWLAENTPPETIFLNPGTKTLEIEETERLLGVVFPKDFKDAYLIHNGQPKVSPGLIDGGWSLHSLDEIKRAWLIKKDLLDKDLFAGITSEPCEGIKNDWWNPCWIPITNDGYGTRHYLDLDPAAEGTAGQIIMMWHDTAEKELRAGSFRSWLEKFVDELEEGKYVFDKEEYYAIVDKDDLL